ncbi:MAG: Holliday junction resolvase RuvX [Acidobacteria bacterium]|nr:Holliday junction resolvase RuvX [Acidobacteriota bacterium]
MGRLMGVDAGTVRVGIALSDELGVMARPAATIPRRGDRGTAEAIRDLARESGVDRIVVGLPLSMAGGEQASSVDARRLAEAIRVATGLPVITWDERLTTAAAERSLIESGVRRERRREIVDQVAAAVLLQGYLDAGAPPSPAPPVASRDARDPEEGGG